nr:conserved phage C-terminal domain-containing protein [uncultured Ruminococcus sp.]
MFALVNKKPIDYDKLFIILPLKLIIDKKLSQLEEHILGLVISLCKTCGQCTMSNQTIADIYKVERESVSKTITKLAKKGLIIRTLQSRTSGRVLKSVFSKDIKTNDEPINNTVSAIDRSITSASDKTITNMSSASDEPYRQLVTAQSPNKNNIRNNKYIVEIKEIIDYLNLKARKNFRSSTAATQSLIKARLNEGFTVEDFKKVIDIKCSEWLGSDYAQYLRPQTLFGTKFESYLNSIDTVKPKKDFDILSTYETL